MPNEFDSTRTGPSAASSPFSPNSTISPPLGDLIDKVAGDFQATKQTLHDGADTVLSKAEDTVSDQTKWAARHVSGIATALEKVGAELEGSDQSEVGHYARKIGSSVQTFAKQMEGKDIGEVATMAEAFGRKQPLAFLGIAAIAGLAASRFLTASSTRSPTKRTSDLPTDPVNRPESGRDQNG
jgi:hypothetical protein